MKKVTLEIKQSTSEEVMNEIITDLTTRFNVIDDSNDKYENIRFVTIDADHVHIDTESLGVTLRDIIKPHIFVAIYQKYLIGLSVEY